MKLNNKSFIKFYILVLFSFIFFQCCNCVLAQEINSGETKNNISIEEQVEIGLNASKFIIAKYGVLEDEYLNKYINDLGQKLVSKVSKKNLKYTFFILDSNEINAFALPGGFIFISRGTLQILSNEDELAAILLHEIAHIEEDHVLNFIEKEK